MCYCMSCPFCGGTDPENDTNSGDRNEDTNSGGDEKTVHKRNEYIQICLQQQRWPEFYAFVNRHEANHKSLRGHHIHLVQQQKVWTPGFAVFGRYKLRGGKQDSIQREERSVKEEGE